MHWKNAARSALDGLGGLAALRHLRRRRLRVPMFHSFRESDRANVEAICEHIARRFEPVPLSAIGPKLPDHAVSVTVDDGYRSFLLYGHPVFRRHRIPVTLYVVAGFADGRIWLWTDQVHFALEHTAKSSLRAGIGDGEAFDLDLSSAEAKARSATTLNEALKRIPNERRLAFLEGLGSLCGIEIPSQPPPECAAMSWDELRAMAAEGVEIGCHTETHPILSRLAGKRDLEREIRGAREMLEQRLGFPVVHFCYPNGKPADISEAAVACVRDAGYATAVTCTYGLNPLEIDRLRIRRLPWDSSTDPRYGAELLVGLHV